MNKKVVEIQCGIWWILQNEAKGTDHDAVHIQRAPLCDAVFGEKIKMPQRRGVINDDHKAPDRVLQNALSIVHQIAVRLLSECKLLQNGRHRVRRRDTAPFRGAVDGRYFEVFSGSAIIGDFGGFLVIVAAERRLDSPSSNRSVNGIHVGFPDIPF